MSCDRIEEQVADFATGRLEASVAAEVARHLAGCASCRAFAEEVRSLYVEVEAPLPHPSPAPAYPLLSARPSGWPPIARGAIAASILIGLILAIHAAGGGGRAPRDASPRSIAVPEDADPGPALASLPLLDVEVTLPRVPSDYRVGTWLDSREEAELLASFTGRPLLEQYRFPQCPICIGAEKTLDRPEARAALAGFVLYRGNVELEMPNWLEEAIPANPDLFPLPAMRVTEGELETAPRLGVSTLESLLDLLREWNALAAGRGADASGSIDAPAFAECTRRLSEVAELVEARSFTEAVQSLEELIRVGARSGTAFAPCAEQVRDQLQRSFDLQLAEIERLYGGSESERRQAVDLARRFRGEVRNLPIESRLALFTE